MPTAISAPSLVVLRGGVTVPVDAVRLLLDLERRGLDVRLDPDDHAVLVGPIRRLSERDKVAIRQHRDALRALVCYCETVQ